MTKTVNLNYTLSPEGQRKAILAGLDGQRQVATTETVEVTADLLEYAEVDSNGGITLRSRIHWDTVPTAADIIAALTREEESRKEAAEKVKKLQEETRAKQIAQRSADEEYAAAIIAEIKSTDHLDPDVDFPGYELCEYLDGDGERRHNGWLRGRHVSIRVDQGQELTRLKRERNDRKVELAAQKKQAEENRRAAIVEEHGGYLWPSGMCDFLGYGLWQQNQDKRWIGVFSGARGIDTFCSSPRGEHIFDVSGLLPGTCIQGGGYNVSRSGKRSRESEFFGVVIRNDDTGLVVKIVGSRADALKAAKTVGL